MFDSMTTTKAYKVTDPIQNTTIEVCTFNATLNNLSGIHMFMNINYPNIYPKVKDDVLQEYRKFTSDITALAVTMGLATQIDTDPSILDNLESVKVELTKIATDTFNQVIESLGDIRVNPVPVQEIGYNPNPELSGFPGYPPGTR